MQCISITSDSAAVILFDRTRPEIQGLYAGELVCGTALMAKGNKGIALIHDSSKLSENSIRGILKKIGNMEFWTLSLHSNADMDYESFHPGFYEKNNPNKVFQNHYERLKGIISDLIKEDSEKLYQKTPEGKQYYESCNRAVLINRKGEISTDSTPPSLYQIIQAPYFEFRRNINELNHVCLSPDELMDCDIQFNGKKFTHFPALYHPLKKIEDEFAPSNQIINIFLNKYKVSLEKTLEEKKQEICKKYKVEKFDHALRRAAWSGDLDDVQFLLEEIKVDSNAKAKNDKTPLHFTVQRGNYLITYFEKTLKQFINDENNSSNQSDHLKKILEKYKTTDVIHALFESINSNEERDYTFLIMEIKKSAEIKKQCIERLKNEISNIKNSYQKVIDLLLMYHANKDLLDQARKTPVNYDSGNIFKFSPPNCIPMSSQFRKNYESKECIYVPQDSGAVILFDQTTPNIEGIYTDGLLCCLCIVVKGDKGIALVHESGLLTENSLRDIFKRIGKIQSWSMVFYPNGDQEYRSAFPEVYEIQFGSEGIFKARAEKIRKIMTQLLGKEAEKKYQKPPEQLYYEAKHKFAFVNRQGQIFTEQEFIPYKIRPHSYMESRYRTSIMTLNNACAEGKQVVECDLLYDGKEFTKMPSLICSRKEIKKKFDVTNLIENFYNNYREAYKKATLTQLLKKYNSNELPLVLRQAAADGNYDGVFFLLRHSIVNINSQGSKSKKTALHYAVEKGTEIISKFLNIQNLLESPAINKTKINQKIPLKEILNHYNAKDRATALCQAILANRQDHITSLLAEADTKKNIKNNYLQILKKRITEETFRYQNLISLLQLNGAGSEIQDAAGKIPFDYNTKNLFT